MAGLSISLMCAWPSFAGSLAANGLQNFIPTYSISDNKLKDFAIAVGFIFAMPHEDEYLSIEGKETNFVFISQPGAIIGGRMQESALKIFGEETKTAVSKLQLDSDVCSVFPIVSQGNQRVILAVNSADQGGLEVSKKCFLLGLLLFDGGTKDDANSLPDLDIMSATFLVLQRHR
jgi:hypothetical protein